METRKLIGALSMLIAAVIACNLPGAGESEGALIPIETVREDDLQDAAKVVAPVAQWPERVGRVERNVDRVRV